MALNSSNVSLQINLLAAPFGINHDGVLGQGRDNYLSQDVQIVPETYPNLYLIDEGQYEAVPLLVEHLGLKIYGGADYNSMHS
jgi:hypothetical protein